MVNHHNKLNPKPQLQIPLAHIKPQQLICLPQVREKTKTSNHLTIPWFTIEASPLLDSPNPSFASVII